MKVGIFGTQQRPWLLPWRQTSSLLQSASLVQAGELSESITTKRSPALASTATPLGLQLLEMRKYPVSSSWSEQLSDSSVSKIL